MQHRVDPVPDAENPASDPGILAAAGMVNQEPHTGQYVIDPASGSLTLRITDAIPQVHAVVIAGTGTASHPFNGGLRFVSNPFMRVGRLGTDANGEGTFDFPFSLGTEGTKIHFQVVFRDAFSSFGLGLTNGTAVDICD